jgi:hypothetical protein
VKSHAKQTQIPDGAAGWGAPGQLALRTIVAPLGMTVGGTVAARGEAGVSNADVRVGDGGVRGSSKAAAVKTEACADLGGAEQLGGAGAGQDDPQAARVLHAIEAAGAGGLAEEELEEMVGDCARATVEQMQLQGLMYVKDGRVFCL